MSWRRPKLGGRYIAWARGAFARTVSMPKQKRPNGSNPMAANELLGPSWSKTPARCAIAEFGQRQA
jgi:hypothetical protein